MRLSEEIRLGAMLKPQGKGEYEYKGATCAIGAALDAAGLLNQPGWHFDSIIKSRWPLLESIVTSPHAAGRPSDWTVFEEILDLNDVHGWSREQIADWVEQ